MDERRRGGRGGGRGEKVLGGVVGEEEEGGGRGTADEDRGDARIQRCVGECSSHGLLLLETRLDRVERIERQVNHQTSERTTLQ